MKKDRSSSADKCDLRRRAEKRLRADKAKGAPARTGAEMQRVLHELQVHQVELEMQNEELRQSRAEAEAGLERYTDLYDFAPVGYLTLDRGGAVRQVNLTGARLLGEERARLSGRRFEWFVAEPDLAGFNTFLNQLFASRAKEACEVLLLKKGKGPLNVQIAGAVSQDGQEARLTLTDITERKQIEKVQLFLLHGAGSAPGEDFFKSLARYLAETLDMDYVCIDRLEGDGLTAETVAVYCDGKFEDNLVYSLKDTPCGDVVGKTICSFARDVRRLFPRDVALQEMMAESYVGTTLWSSRGNPIGLIALIGRQPRADLGLAEAILRLVAIRAAGELERREAEAETQRLASFPLLSPNPVVEANAAGQVQFCNPAAERIFPDLCRRGPEHRWLSSWASVMRILCKGGSKSMVREVLVDERWYQQTIHLVENEQRARIYGVDITARQKAGEELFRAYAEVEKRVVDRTAELVELNKDLELQIRNRKKAEKALRHRTMELRGQTISLGEANAALKILLKQREADKNELEEKVLLNVNQLIIPYVEKVRRGKLDAKQKAYVGILKSLFELSPGAHILIRMDGYTLSRNQVPAKVVWCKPLENKAIFRYGIGVTFIDPGRGSGVNTARPVSVHPPTASEKDPSWGQASD